MNPIRMPDLPFFARRLETVQDMTEPGLNAAQAATGHGVTASTAHANGFGRYLADASSRPKRSPKGNSPGTALLIVELRRKCWLQVRIAQQVGVSTATVSRVLTRAGLSRLSGLQPREPVQRYEHEAMGNLLHINIKKLGRIDRLSHQVTGHRHDSIKSIGWEFLLVRLNLPELSPTRLGAAPHHGIGHLPPMSRLPTPRNNFLTLHTYTGDPLRHGCRKSLPLWHREMLKRFQLPLSI